MVTVDDFSRAVDLINKSTSVLVTSHTRPDGDACGSILAMCNVITTLGKKAQPLLLSPLANWYSFLFASPAPILGNDVTLQQLKDGEFGNFDLVIIVDTNSYVQLPEFDKWLKSAKITTFVVDHHVTGDGLGDVELVDTTAAATGEIIFDLIKYAGWQITKSTAEDLWETSSRLK